MQNTINELFIKYKQHPSQDSLVGLLQVLQPVIYSVSYKVLKNKDDCNDVTQDVILKLIKEIHRINDIKNIFGWVYQIAFHDALEFKRKNIQHRALTEINIIKNKPNDSDDTSYVLHEHIGYLDIESQQLILLKFFENKTFEEIFTITGKAYSSAHRDIQKILGKLKITLENSGYFSISSSLTKILETNIQIPANSFVLNETVSQEIKNSIQRNSIRGVSTLTSTKSSVNLATILPIAVIAILGFSLIAISYLNPSAQEQEIKPLFVKVKKEIVKVESEKMKINNPERQNNEVEETKEEFKKDPKIADATSAEDLMQTKAESLPPLPLIEKKQNGLLIQGRILNQANQQAVTNAKICVYNISLNQDTFLETDEKGGFTYNCENKLTTFFHFKITHPDFASKEVTYLKENENLLTIYLNQGTSVSGKFLKEGNREPIKNYTITLISNTPSIYNYSNKTPFPSWSFYEKIPNKNKIILSFIINNEKGEFLLKKIPEGKYLIMFSGNDFEAFCYYGGYFEKIVKAENTSTAYALNKFNMGVQIQGLNINIPVFLLPKFIIAKIHCVDADTQEPLFNVAVQKKRFGQELNKKVAYTDLKGQIEIMVADSDINSHELDLTGTLEGYTMVNVQYKYFENSSENIYRNGSIKNSSQDKNMIVMLMRKTKRIETMATNSKGEALPYSIVNDKYGHYLNQANEKGEVAFEIEKNKDTPVLSIWDLQNNNVIFKLPSSGLIDDTRLQARIFGSCKVQDKMKSMVIVLYKENQDQFVVSVPIYENGKFDIINLPSGNYEIVLNFQSDEANYDYARTVTLISGEQKQIDLNFDKSFLVNIKVENGVSLENQGVFYYFELNSFNDSGNKYSGYGSDRTKPLRFYVMDLTRFDLIIEVEPQEGRQLVGYSVISDFTTTAECKLDFLQKNKIEILVLDKLTNERVDDFVFSYESNNKADLGGSFSSIMKSIYVKPSVKSELYKFSVNAPGYTNYTNIVVLHNQSPAKFIIYLEKESNALIIKNVLENSAASKCGILVGDILVSYAEKRVSSFEELNLIKQKSQSHQVNSIKILRNNKIITLEIDSGKMGIEIESIYVESLANKK